MSSSQYHAVSEISPQSYNWIIKVRIIRLWRGVLKTGEQFKSLNLLLLDDKNTRIHAFVSENVVANHEPILAEGNIVVISNFSVKEYKVEEKFRCIHSETQIFFTNYTQVMKMDEPDSLIATNMFDFYDLSDLSAIANENVYLTDVIGIIEKDQPMVKLVNKFGVSQTKVKFTIVDGRASVNVTFWDSLAENFSNILQEVKEYPPIIIIASAKINSWTNTNTNETHVEISNASATKFYINLEHYNVIQLRKIINTPKFSKYNFSIEVPEETETLRIIDINKMEIGSLEKEVVCYVRFKSLIESRNCFIFTCSACYKQVQEKEGEFRCYRCSDRIVMCPYKRWQFTVLAEDTTGTTQILVNDREARTILGLDADELEEKETDLAAFPSILTTILNKYYTVKLLIKGISLEQSSTSFTATGIYEDVVNRMTQTNDLPEQISQVSTSSYHLDNLSQMDFSSTPVASKKKRSLKKKKGKFTNI